MEKKLFSVKDVDNFDSQKTIELYKRFLNSGLITLTGLINFDKVYKKAEGCIIEDIHGNEYIDFLGGYGSLNIGHNHPYVVESLSNVKERPNILQAGLNPYAAALASNLSALTLGVLKRAFLCNSGAEAVEGALKLARAATGKKKIIYCSNSFHGKTFGALSVTGREKYRQCFKPLLPDCDEVAYGDESVLEKLLTNKDVAAFIVEPIQGEGGIILPHEGYLKTAGDLCSRYDALLIVDEIQTGMGRTGRMFAYEYDGAKPDIICLAKSLGGGIMPIGAYLTTDSAYQKAYGGIDKCLLHTSTFGGNTYACVAALAALEVICGEDLAAQAEEKGEYLLHKLGELKNKYSIIKDVRGKGLMIGIEFNNKSSRVVNYISMGALDNITNEFFASLVAGKLLNEHRILTAYTLNNPNVIRIEPPLTVSFEQLDKLIYALDKIFEENKGFIGMALGNVRNLVRKGN